MKLGKAIKISRIQREMKQAELAELAEISVSYLSLLEQDKRDPPFSTVQRLSRALGVPISVLVFLAAEKGEIPEISSDLSEKLSIVARGLIGNSSDVNS